MSDVNEKNHGTLTGDNHAALWSGRFTEGPDAAAVEFETSIRVDERMALDDIHGSIAHAQMLGEQKIISKSESSEIVKGLKSIEKDLISGELKIDYSAEDIHSFVEAVLTDRIGEPGKKLHTGRSRNDQIALDERLYLRRMIPCIQNEILTLIKTLSEIASKNKKSLLTGYTHMQHAQPGTLAQHLLAWASMLVRDWERLEDSLKRIEKSPLGSGALQGSTLPLDRELVAKKLGFSGVTENSLDTVSDRDYCIEFTSDFALLQSHLSRMCEEVVLWSTDKIKDLFINKYNITKQVNVIPTGIDIDKFKITPSMKKNIQTIKNKYKIKDTDFVIGSVGRIAPEKSFDKLLYNIKDMIKVNTNIKVLLVGGGPDLDNLKELTKKLNLENYVIFTDKVNYDLVPTYFNIFNIVVSFSKTETQGLTIIEGLAASKPTLCIEDDSFRAMIEPNYK